MNTIKKPHAFQPILSETLEVRVVPSSIHPVFHSHVASVPAASHNLISQNGPRGLGTHNGSVTTNGFTPHLVRSLLTIHSNGLATTHSNTTSPNGPRGLGTNFGPGRTNGLAVTSTLPTSGNTFSSNGPHGLGTDFGPGTTNRFH